jgi:ankyrin repeat protein
VNVWADWCGCLQFGRTALHCGSKMGDVRVVEMLLEHGATVNVANVVSFETTTRFCVSGVVRRLGVIDNRTA